MARLSVRSSASSRGQLLHVDSFQRARRNMAMEKSPLVLGFLGRIFDEENALSPRRSWWSSSTSTTRSTRGRAKGPASDHNGWLSPGGRCGMPRAVDVGLYPSASASSLQELIVSLR